MGIASFIDKFVPDKSFLKLPLVAIDYVEDAINNVTVEKEDGTHESRQLNHIVQDLAQGDFKAALINGVLAGEDKFIEPLEVKDFDVYENALLDEISHKCALLAAHYGLRKATGSAPNVSTDEHPGEGFDDAGEGDAEDDTQ